MYVNSEAGFPSLRIVKGVNHLIYNQQYQHGRRTSISYYLQSDISTDIY